MVVQKLEEIMNFKAFVLLVLSVILMSCGKDQMASDSQSGSASAVISSGTCKMMNGGTLSGCCSSHGGAKNCTTGLYLFTSSNSLICNDGTISPSCTGPK